MEETIFSANQIAPANPSLKDGGGQFKPACLVVLGVLLPLAGTNLTRSVVVIRTSLTGDLVRGFFFGRRVGTNLSLSVVEMTMDLG